MRSSAVEGAAYDKRVDVYSQRNDWVKSQFRMYWATIPFSRSPLGAGGNMQRGWSAILPGNPLGQKTDEYREYLQREVNTPHWV